MRVTRDPCPTAATGGPRPAAAAGALVGLLLLGGATIADAQDTAPAPAARTEAAEPKAPGPEEPEAAAEPARTEPAGPGFQVIVHASIGETRLPAKTVTKMFLKKARRWNSGELVVPVDLGPRHPVRQLFTRAVHDRSVTAVVGYWQRVIFAGRGEPPESKATEPEVLAFVAANPGAIGYVSDGIELGDDVRRLAVDDLNVKP